MGRPLRTFDVKIRMAPSNSKGYVLAGLSPFRSPRPVPPKVRALILGEIEDTELQQVHGLMSPYRNRPTDLSMSKAAGLRRSLPASLLTSLAGIVDNCEDTQPGLKILPKADRDNLLPHRASSIAKSFRGASFRLGGFFFSISWRRIGFERLNQPHRDRSYIVDRSEECRFVRFRRLVETGNFSDELQ
jgi:hypothetical protein